MLVSISQAVSFLRQISITSPDLTDCDGCFELIAEFADAEKRGEELPYALQLVKNHLRQCRCCAYEYEILLEGLQAAEEIDE